MSALLIATAAVTGTAAAAVAWAVIGAVRTTRKPVRGRKPLRQVDADMEIARMELREYGDRRDGAR